MPLTVLIGRLLHRSCSQGLARHWPVIGASERRGHSPRFVVAPW